MLCAYAIVLMLLFSRYPVNHPVLVTTAEEGGPDDFLEAEMCIDQPI